MPHFDEYGGDEWICQICGKIQNSRTKSQWLPKLTGSLTAANVCPFCIKKHEDTGLTGQSLRDYIRPVMSLYEYCKEESGLTGRALEDYINRHYGHG